MRRPGHALSERRPRVSVGARVEGFTLVELLIAMVVVAVVAVSVVAATAMGGTGAARVRSAARVLFATAQGARADAVAQGRRVELVLDLDSRERGGAMTQVFWTEFETDPFTAPGEMGPAPGLAGTPQAIGDGVRMMGVERGAEPGRQMASDETQALTSGLVTIAFLADGTCQPAELWLGFGDEGLDQLVVVVDGVTGRVRILDADELEAERSEQR